MNNTLIKILNITCHIDCSHRYSRRGSWRAEKSDKRELPSNEYIEEQLFLATLTICLKSQPNGIIALIWLIELATHNIRIASKIYDIKRELYNDNELKMM